MQATITEQTGEPLSRAAERTVADAIDSLPGFSAQLRAPRAHGGDVLATRPDGGLWVVEVRSANLDEQLHDGITFEVGGLARHRRLADDLGAIGVVLVGVWIERANCTAELRAIGGEHAESVARRNLEAYLSGQNLSARGRTRMRYSLSRDDFSVMSFTDFFSADVAA